MQGTKTTSKALDQISGQNQVNQVSHPLSNHPCFKLALDRLSKTNVNLLDLPGKLDLKPYWKDAFVKKSAFEGVEIK